MMKLITEELLDTVTSQAKENSRLRMNYNFHASMDAPIHRLLNALEPGTYLPPHRHTGKEETYLVLRGSLLAFFYDDAGDVTDKVCLNLRKVNMVWRFLLIHGIALLPWSQVPLFLKLKKVHISLYPQRIWLRGLLRLLMWRE